MIAKKELLKLARETIISELKDKELVIDERIKKEFSEKKACFVTLSKNGVLRGCIGSLIPHQELWKDVIENAKNAAFNDIRFPPLIDEELDEIKIEISILSIPKEIHYKNLEDLKRKIKGKGVIIYYSSYSATYLPQVWEEIKNEEEFLSSLCLKAGLGVNFWKNNELRVKVYEVEKIKEI